MCDIGPRETLKQASYQRSSQLISPTSRQAACARRKFQATNFKGEVGVIQITGPPTHKRHMILTPRPSRFSAYNIEKLAWT